MSLAIKDIEKEALNLSVPERERLASKIFNSIHNENLTDIDNAWLDLAEERFHKLVSKKEMGTTEREFYQNLKDRFSWM